MAADTGLHRAALDALSAHVAVVDAAGRIIAVNEAWRRFARENGDPSLARTGPGQSYLDVCRRTADPAAHEALNGLEAVLAGARSRFDLEYACHSPSEQRWFQMYGAGLNGEVQGAVIVHVDITRRKGAEARLLVQFAAAQALEASATLGQAASRLIQAVCEGLVWDVGDLWELDSQARELRCTDIWHLPHVACAEFAELTRGMVFRPGSGLPGRIWSAARPAWIRDVREDPNFPRAPAAARCGLRGAFGFPIVLEGEVLAVIEFFSHDIREPDPDVLQMFSAVGSQIGQFIRRRRAEQTSRDIIEFAPDPMVLVDDRGRIALANRQVETVFGYARADLLGRAIELLVPERVRETHVRHRLAYASAPEPRPMGTGGDLRARRKDGSEFPAEISLSPLATADGVMVLAAIRDVTRRQEFEKRLSQAQRLESIGQLAAGIAHEINTPTQYIGDNAQFLGSALGDLIGLIGDFRTLLQAVKEGALTPAMVVGLEAALQERDVDDLIEQAPLAGASVEEGVKRVSEIVRAMRQFSHQGGEDKSLVDVNEAIETTLAVARGEWKYVAEAVTDLDPQLPRVRCVAGQLNQALLNLIVNAAHAIGDVVGDGTRGKGTIIVSTRRDGDWVEIRVRDTGAGIPEKIRDRIFDPFFTTKEVGRGTGQGLAIVRSVIVQRHGGAVSVETEAGRGTTFVLRLPTEPAAPALEGEPARV